MQESDTDWLATAFETVFTAIFAETFGIFFLLGLLIGLLGIGLMVLYALSRSLGYRTTGTVVGAISKVRIKQREQDGEMVDKVRNTLYPVYEYTAADGSRRQMRGSEGGTMTLGYTTGQAVQLIVREDDGYDDVYDADQRGALYFGLGMLAAGLVIMASMGNAASAFGIGLVSILGLALLRLVAGLLVKLKSPSRAKRSGNDYSKAFAPEDLHPIEHFQSA